MTPRANALRVGLFGLGGIALLVAAVVTVFGGRLFTPTERAVMHFSGSVYGLQVGAPVVFRGVRMGSVTSIGVVLDTTSGRFAVPVVAEIERGAIRDMNGQPVEVAAAVSLQRLVERGLQAQLALQSVLTGQLYVDLDLAPGATPVRTLSAAPRRDGLIEIPTTATRLQSLLEQVQGLDLRRLVDEITAAASAARQTLGGPQLRRTIDEMAGVAANLSRLSQSLERRVGPLADAAEGTLMDARRAAGQAGSAAERMGQAAERVGAAAGRLDGVLAPDSPLLVRLQNAADELARSATALRQMSAPDSASVVKFDRALDEVARAARAVREMADLLERQPDALIRGRPAAAP